MDIEQYIKKLPNKSVIARQDGTYTVLPSVVQGRVPRELLANVLSVVEEFDLPEVRMTAAQKLMIDGVTADILPDVIERVGSVGSLHKFRVQGCIGTRGCKLAMRDSIGVAEKLEEFLESFTLPTKLKSSASGCSMCCAESMVRDVGLIGRKNGWTVAFGGNGGKRVRKADILATDVTDEEAFEIIGKALDFYAKNAKVKERTARFVERVGIDAVKEAVFAD